ncbi:YdeI/OmpD-associated family protein [Pontibacter sp. E15-1]|uniref:YdeI/OmpD-associated family protein n=1 Tax=Pontibacter sp. E15-1 TaxID=2919918 RepID=UPI001F4FA83B|nr:YdeI/OmpD-associated family protein [Pontibacter sp. E15-1]MCJ8166158.1 YdeI/OmpD-associated family protein [Pontibacter sp. E15-1]
MPELLKKLQLKPSHTLLLVNVPEEVAAVLTGMGGNVTQADQTPTSGAFDAALLFVMSGAELEQDALKVIGLLKPEGMLWVAYPKKSSGIETDLTRDKGWSAMAALGYEPVRQVAINQVWSALRFIHRAARKTTSTFGVDMPGIDLKTKTVTVPDDMQLALEEAGLSETFSQLAFTHRKEYVVAVLEARRPETRTRRIRKAVEQLAQKERV